MNKSFKTLHLKSDATDEQSATLQGYTTDYLTSEFVPCLFRLPQFRISKSDQSTVQRPFSKLRFRVQDFSKMPFKDLLKKKEKVEEKDMEAAEEQPQFTFMRSDTHTQELIRPPTFSSHNTVDDPPYAHTESKTHRLFKGRSRSGSVNSTASVSSRASQKSSTRSPNPRRLSERLHLKKSEPTSESVPRDLPDIQLAEGENGGLGAESQWEKRATMLARKNEQSRSRPVTPSGGTKTDLGSFSEMSIGRGSGSGGREAVVATKQTDDNIQEAIRLHEAGELVTSTSMFGRLADPNGENNALSQVLYGLALRYVNRPHSCGPDHIQYSGTFWEIPWRGR